MKQIRFFGWVALLLANVAAATDAPLPTVASVDLARYLGTWYEIASFPQSFQKGCTATVAEYSLLPSGKIAIKNSCNLNALDGKLKVANGKAYVADPISNSKLRVTFFWPFYGDYWILDLGPNYEYAMVGAPDRDYLWFLSRKRALDKNELDHLTEKATALGFDVSRLKTTLQP